MKSARSKACDIKPSVRQRVLERDNHRCIFCGSSSALTIAHFVGRGRGGLGIEQNLVVACMTCHMKADQGTHTREYHRQMCHYLKKKYPDTRVEELVYKRV